VVRKLKTHDLRRIARFSRNLPEGDSKRTGPDLASESRKHIIDEVAAGDREARPAVRPAGAVSQIAK